MIKENLKKIKLEISNHANSWDRPEPALFCVTKYSSKEEIEKAIELGHRNFAENKVQDAIKKYKDLKEIHRDLKLNLIGHLQTNKVKEALEIFDCIETIDSEKLAKKIKDNLADDSAHEFLIQVNIGEEEQKYGIMPEQTDEFIEYCINDLKLPVKGLMCIPPNNENPSPYFAYLKKIADRNNLNFLSIGMSSDFKQAIEVGSSEVRIGSAIFSTC